MMLPELIAGLGVRPADPGRDLQIRVCDLTDDSRTVVPGSLFVARKGRTTDARVFAGAAVDAGAVAVLSDDPALALPAGVPLLLAEPVALASVTARLAERFYGDPTSRLTLIGITGTKGKTTTAHLVHQILNAAGTRCGLVGTVAVDDGVEVAPATLTTPPATELSRTYARMLEAGCRAAVMEVSSHALDQGRAAGLSFTAGVFTNLTGDHLDYHGTMERYGRAKAALFAMLPPTGTAVVNADDPAAGRMIEDCRAPVLHCAFDRGEAGGRRPSSCRVTVAESSMAGTAALFRGPWGVFEVRLRLIGRHNAMNALEAAAACWAAGLSAEELKHGLETASAPPGRFEPVAASGDGFAVFVDYAHTDDALRQALTALRPLVGEGGRLRVVFGCGGDRDRSKRPRMGRVAAELADDVYLTSDNPRSEQPEAVIAEVLRGIPGPGPRVEPDRRAAISAVIEDAMPGDIVLIAGKGHETYQIVPDGRGGTATIPFDDRAEAREALERKRSVRAAGVPLAGPTCPAGVAP